LRIVISSHNSPRSSLHIGEEEGGREGGREGGVRTETTSFFPRAPINHLAISKSGGREGGREGETYRYDIVLPSGPHQPPGNIQVVNRHVLEEATSPLHVREGRGGGITRLEDSADGVSDGAVGDGLVEPSEGWVEATLEGGHELDAGVFSHL